jgi:hypothetical protein
VKSRFQITIFQIKEISIHKNQICTTRILENEKADFIGFEADELFKCCIFKIKLLQKQTTAGNKTVQKCFPQTGIGPPTSSLLFARATHYTTRPRAVNWNS